MNKTTTLERWCCRTLAFTLCIHMAAFLVGCGDEGGVGHILAGTTDSASGGSGSSTVQCWDDAACGGPYGGIACFDYGPGGGIIQVPNPGNVAIQCGCPAGTPNCP